MSAQPFLVLAWLVLAHLVADFVLQTQWIAGAKASHGRRAVVGLVAHGLVVSLCVTPVGFAYGDRGWWFVVVTALSHVAIDRSKVLLTRRAAAAALAVAHRRHEAETPIDHLGRAWTPVPAALFLADQLAHFAVAGLGWAVLLSMVPLTPDWVATVNRWLAGWDLAVVHDVISIAVIVVSLVIINVRAASLFVSILVRPVEVGRDGANVWGGRVAPATAAAVASSTTAGVRRWSIRIGPFEARVTGESEPAPPSGAPPSAAPTSAAFGPLGANARVGATIGVLERILIVVFVLTGSEAAIGFVVAAKTLARFRLLDDRDFAEYYLLGTLASVSVAIITGLVGRATLGVLLA